MVWLTGWNKRKSKIVNGTSAGNQTNYQMKLTINFGPGTDTENTIYLGENVRTDFGDLRFTLSDGTTLLNYWIESFSPGLNAIVWINIPSIPSSPGNTTIYIYYNNPSSVSTSNASNTFLFFDDFDRPNGPPGNGWVIESGNWSINDGVLQVNDTGGSGQFIRRPNTTMVGIWEWKQRTNFNNFANRIQGRLHFIVPGNSPTTDSYYINTYYGESLRRFEKFVNGGFTAESSTSPTLDTSFHNYRIIRDNSGNITRYIDDIVDGTTVTWTDLSSSTNIYLSIAGPGAGGIYYVDDIRVRNYVLPEPTFGSSGVEEEASGILNISSSPSGARIFIDNIDQGINTPSTITGLSTGSHEYRLTLVGFPDIIGTFTIIPEAITTVSVPMDLSVGSLNISSSPPTARIFIDDIDQGTVTPATLGGISPGQHNYKLTLSGYLDNTGLFSIVAASTTEISVQMISTTGNLSISSIPSGARIFIDNIDQNILTPNTITGLSAGDHTYRLTLLNYQDRTGSFTINSGQTTIISTNLISTPGIKNGSFDTDLNGWTANANTYWDTGRARLVMNGELSQIFDITGDILEFDWEVGGTNGGAAYQVYIGDTLISSGPLGSGSGWGTEFGHVRIDLGDRIGQVIKLLFYNRNWTFTTLWVDNVIFQNYVPGITNGDFEQGLVEWFYNPALASDGALAIEPSSSWGFGTGNVLAMYYYRYIGPTEIFQGFVIDKCFLEFDYSTGFYDNFGWELYIDNVLYYQTSPNSATTGRESINVSDYIGHKAKILFYNRGGHGLGIDNVSTIASPYDVFVDSYPIGAQIFVDNVDTGLTTQNIPIPVNTGSTGSHLITLKLAGFTDYNETVNVIPCQPITLTALFEGCIKFISDPPSNICIDNIDRGQTPTIICNLVPGNSHTYIMALKNYIPKIDTIVIPSQKGFIIDQVLTHETGNISFNSDPVGAKIVIDGIDTGRFTPDTVNINTGIHDCILSLDGYYDYNIIISVILDQTRQISVSLDQSTLYQPQSITNGTFNTDINGWTSNITGNGFVQFDNGTAHLYGNNGAYIELYQDFVISKPVLTFSYMTTALNDAREGGWNLTVEGNVKSWYGRSYLQWTHFEEDVTEFIGKGARFLFYVRCNLWQGMQSDVWIDNILNTPTPKRFATIDSLCTGPYSPCQDNPVVECSSDVYIDNILLGKSPINKNSLAPGSHPYLLRKLGYKDFDSGTDDITGEIPIRPRVSSSVFITRIFESKTDLPAPNCVLFDSNPQGAKIFINNINTGRVTPWTICLDSLISPLLNPLISNLVEYNYRLSLLHYYDVSGTVNTNNLIGENVTENLVLKVGSISISSIPSGARIILDGTDTGMVTPSTLTDVIEGLHTYDLILDNFNTYTCQICLLPETTFTANPILTPIEDSIYIDSCPSARIFLDDVDTGNSTPLQIFNLLGHHKYGLRLVGYVDYDEEIDMPIGGGINRRIILERRIGVPFLDPVTHICNSTFSLVPYSPVPLDGNSKYYGKSSLKSSIADVGRSDMMIIDAQGYNAIHVYALFSKAYIGGDNGTLNIYQTDSLGDCSTQTIPPDVEILFSVNSNSLPDYWWYLHYLFEGSFNLTRRYVIIQTILSATQPGYVEIDIMESIPIDCEIIQGTVCRPAGPCPTEPSLLNVTVSNVPDVINSGNTSQITVHVTDATGTFVQGANITISVPDGTLDPITGITDINGDFISTYTAPTVTTTQIFTILVNVSKGYLEGSGSTEITINPLFIPILTSIEISPSSANVIIGETQQFSVTCRDQNNNEITCPTIVWSVSDTTKGMISDTGLFTGISEGITIITATSDTVIGTALVTVIPVVQAGFGNAGMTLLGGLLIGALLFRKKCKDYKTREECERAGCLWKDGKCIERK